MHEHELENLDKIIDMLKKHRQGMAAYDDKDDENSHNNHINDKDSKDLMNGYRKHY